MKKANWTTKHARCACSLTVSTWERGCVLSLAPQWRLADERDKPNQMAPFPVAPVYSPHALIKTLRLAPLPKTCVYSCLCVCLCAPSTDILLKIASCWSGVFLIWLYASRHWTLPLGSTPVLFCVHVHVFGLGLGTRVCCVCLLLFTPGANHLIHKSTIIKPIKREVLPYGWVSLLLFPTVSFIKCLWSVFLYLHTGKYQLCFCCGGT